MTTMQSQTWRITAKAMLAVGVLIVAAELSLGQSSPAVKDTQSRVADTGKPKTDLYGDPLPPGAILRMGSTRLKHSQAALAFSKDGKLLISAGQCGDVRFWEAATGKEIRRVQLDYKKRDSTYLSNPEFTMDGTRLAMWEPANQVVSVFDTATGKRLREFPVGPADWCRGELLSNGTTLGITSRFDVNFKPREVQFLDVATGKEISRRSLDRIRSWDVSSDGKWWACSVDSKEIRLVDLRTDKEVGRLDFPATQVRLSPDGKILAAAAERASAGVTLWETRTLKEVGAYKPLQDDFLSLGPFSPDGRFLAIDANNQEIIFWDTASKQVQSRVPERLVWHTAFSPDGKVFACTRDMGIHFWDVATGKRLLDLSGHADGVWDITVSPDGRLAASSAWFDRRACLWDTQSGKLVRVLEVPNDSPRGCEFSADGRFLVTAGREGTLQLWEVDTGKEMRRFEFETVNGFGWNLQDRQCFHLPADGKRLAAVGMHSLLDKAEADLRIWDTKTGKLLDRRLFPIDFMIRPNPGGGSASRMRLHSCFTPNGELLTEWSENALRITETLTGRVRAVASGAFISPTAFSPDGKLLAAGVLEANGDRFEAHAEAIALIEVLTGKEVVRLDVKKPQLIAFTPDSRFLATTDTEKIHFWDLSTGREVHRWNWPTGLTPHPSWSPVGAIAFLPDGKRLITGMLDGTLLVWDLSELAKVARPTTVNLSAESIKRLWDDLRSDDARIAYQARTRLANSPDQAVVFLEEHLRPAEPPDPKRIEKLLADLDSDRFATREAANKELQSLAEQIEPILRRTLEGQPSPEVRKRIQGLLAGPRVALTGEQLRRLRAIQVLEAIGTPPACEVLKKLAAGAERAPETGNAKAALGRIRISHR
jgi:WD40 repeat protein